MSSIVDVLAEIRKRPGIFLGRPSMRILYAFLSGYAHARRDNHTEDYELLSGFNEYVRARFKTEGTYGWARIIEFKSPNEEQEMKLFWKLLDEFCAKQSTKSKGKKKAPRASPEKHVA